MTQNNGSEYNPNHDRAAVAKFVAEYGAAATAPVSQVERGALLRAALVAHNPHMAATFAGLPELQS